MVRGLNCQSRSRYTLTARANAYHHVMGLEAQNHATEIKLRAERKAGELLGELGKGKNQYDNGAADSLSGASEYRQALEAEAKQRQETGNNQHSLRELIPEGSTGKSADQAAQHVMEVEMSEHQC